MTDRFFLDTNVLVYAFDKSDQKKRLTAKELIKSYILEPNYFISAQVIQEFFVTVTQKIKEKIKVEIALEVIKKLFESNILIIEKNTITKAIELKKSYHLSFWDCLIISAGLENKCSILYSEDMQDKMEIEGLKIINPIV